MHFVKHLPQSRREIRKSGMEMDVRIRSQFVNTKYDRGVRLFWVLSEGSSPQACEGAYFFFGTNDQW